ncbi:MAG: NAD(P)/FAD-dependent oxidoreductase [Flavobacteriales bacterium]|nr:NAD(P)/FAD-dependent oxidoreductase [Flavobacteriales bacterium]
MGPRVVVVGGGAAGFFAALTVKEHAPGTDVILLEKTRKLLSKVRVSGGGRCNVTHTDIGLKAMVASYPRGGKFLRKAFQHWDAADTVDWFNVRGVELKTEADGRMFPVTDSSATITDLLEREARRLRIEIRLGEPFHRLEQEGNRLVAHTSSGPVVADRIIVCIGGSKVQDMKWAESLGHDVVPPVPSLFTFNLPDDPIRKLMGVSVDRVRVRIAGAKWQAEGPLLITHWGMSGPAILRLSAFAARELHAVGYQFEVLVDWTAEKNAMSIRDELDRVATSASKRLVRNAPPFSLPQRLWEFLLNRAMIGPQQAWGSLGRKQHDKLIEVLVNDRYEARGKTTFKEEFVTAGGIALSEVDPDTMQSRKVPGLHFAGEVLDIDGITGGFNFQAAWTTGRIAGMAASHGKL